VSTHSFTNLTTRFKINEPDVIAETIDGEVIIINLNSGAYYSSLGSGGAIWQALIANHSVDEALDLVAASYGAERGVIEPEVSQFVSQLLDEGLLIEVTDVPPGDGVVLATVGVFETPVLSKYVDMQELLLLDPIHDVDPSVGWPFPKASE
jgi:hypothetical protein